MNAYIIAGYRTAVAKAKRGGFRTMRPDDLAAEVIKHLMKQVPNLDPARVDDLIVGNAIPEAEQGMQMARYISLLSLPKNVPGFIINRYCGSGLEAIALASAKVASGMADCVIAGGTESMSMLPMMGHKTVLNYGIANEHPDYYIGMGLTAEEVSKKYNVTRDEQDAFSFASHMKALEAQKAGKFTSQIVPVEVTENYFDAKSGKKQTRSWTVSEDEGPRADTTIEALGKLKPAFAMGGTVTAGNASQTSDGAAFVLVVSEKLVKELHLEPIARMVSYATAGVEPSLMGIGPVEAIPIALKKAGLTLKDIQQIELNEAFAAQSLAVMKTLDIDPNIVNVNGGAIALGHPLGCSGAKLSIQLFNEMRLRNQKYGMVTACVGGGQGVAGIYELL
ncbi:acetyl-CoA C-acyltransferase [Aquirufa antheringensis]|uniref:acetyl-CoA C-acyltransferase n=1 Tax=Aquirufa antheringensis TaxID=2516559 RepID=A0A4Q9BA45_9BACT|nr:acetyl-CoA C-acyltransferase [Aquirufa antheringensis]MCE4215949.1 acetyl-CoA C-acyltransferase [Pseudarcicella sp. GAP-15]TBH70297.1 acetyl-CoA C-acyltransferase [Aquirufa antheringensis]TBH72106.1 acetyl-CoA C-acyltransferase [Aquirufa antheringensis]